MTVIMTLLVRDEEDVLPAMLEHHLAAGVDHVVVTDNASGPAAAAILDRYVATGRVTVIHEPATDYRQDVWVTRMARLAFTAFDADWVINADADEFYWPLDDVGNPVAGPEIDLGAVLARVDDHLGGLVVQRENLVALPGITGTWPERLRLRDLRSLSERGSRIGPKVVHRGDPVIDVAFGNHDASSPTLGPVSPDAPLVAFHAADRSYESFSAKIRRGGESVASNPALSPEVSWHWRADHRRLLDGTLEQTWSERQPSPAQVREGLLGRTLRPESALLQRLLHLQRRPVVDGALDPVLGPPAPPARRLLPRGLRRAFRR